MDGSHISGVTYRNIHMSSISTPVYMYYNKSEKTGATPRIPRNRALNSLLYIGARSRRPGSDTHVGSISDITLDGITAKDIKDQDKAWASTLDGQPSDDDAGVDETHVIGPGITVSNAHFTYKGGGSKSDAKIKPPHPYDEYSNKSEKETGDKSL
eukprot:gene17045-biopygen9810